MSRNLLHEFSTWQIGPNEDVTKVNLKIVKFLKDNSAAIRDEIAECDIDELLTHQKSWTKILVRHYYKYCLNEDFGLYAKKPLYGKKAIHSNNGQILMDREFLWEEDRLIDKDAWGCSGLQIWIRIVRMIYRLHDEDDYGNEIDEFVTPIDMEEITRETIEMWKPNSRARGGTQIELLVDFLGVMAKIGKYFAQTRNPSIYIMRSSLELYINTMMMIDPSLLIPNYDPDKEVTIAHERHESIHTEMEEFMDGWRPSSRSIETNAKLLLCLVGYPGIRRHYILKELYGNPEDYFKNQFNIHLFKPTRLREAMKEFQPTAFKGISKFNPQEMALEYFWMREEDKETFSNDWKLVLLHNMIQNKMLYEGTIPRFVFNVDMYARHQDFLNVSSRSFPIIVKLDPYHHWILSNEEFSSGTTEAIIAHFCESLARLGIPKMETWESNPPVYEWIKMFPTICKPEYILSTNVIKKNPIRLGVRTMQRRQREREEEQDQINLEFGSYTNGITRDPTRVGQSTENSLVDRIEMLDLLE